MAKSKGREVSKGNLGVFNSPKLLLCKIVSKYIPLFFLFDPFLDSCSEIRECFLRELKRLQFASDIF